jgi:hypothetical protein
MKQRVPAVRSYPDKERGNPMTKKKKVERVVTAKEILNSGEWAHKTATYSDPSAAHEKALRLQSAGAKTIKITPTGGRFVVSWMER